jgi:hypothetical protein
MRMHDTRPRLWDSAIITPIMMLHTYYVPYRLEVCHGSSCGNHTHKIVKRMKTALHQHPPFTKQECLHAGGVSSLTVLCMFVQTPLMYKHEHRSFKTCGWTSSSSFCMCAACFSCDCDARNGTLNQSTMSCICNSLGLQLVPTL